jgi:hypothetical protein
MKYFLLLIGLVAAVLAALMYVPLENGRPALDPDSMRQLLSESTAMAVPAEEEEVLPAMYRWRDASGRWQYGQVPPPGVNAEPMEQKDTRTVSPEALRQGALPEDSQ